MQSKVIQIVLFYYVKFDIYRAYVIQNNVWSRLFMVVNYRVLTMSDDNSLSSCTKSPIKLRFQGNISLSVLYDLPEMYIIIYIVYNLRSL